MPKYGQMKYKTFRYGRYKAVKKAIGSTVRYRMNGVITRTTVFNGELINIRMRSNNSDYVVCKSITLLGDRYKVRIRSNNSTWIISNRIILEEIRT